MIWEDEQELLKEFMYWQKRALKAERELKLENELLDLIMEWNEQTITEKEYWKQQFLDKEKELRR